MVMFMLVLPGSAGCQLLPPPPSKQLIRPQEFLDLTGLISPRTMDELGVIWAVPRGWDASPIRRNALYTHQQFRSPGRTIGVGVASIRLPFPFSASFVAWLAKNEYLKRAAGHGPAELLARWADDSGREWFEARDTQYHARGYIRVSGLKAWIVYSGHRLVTPPDPVELGIAGRSASSVVPKP
jgi:hypothetical protein